MDTITSRLSDLFSTFPEAVILLDEGEAVYANEAGKALLQDAQFPADLLFALAEHPGDSIDVATALATYRVSVSALEGGVLLVLRPLPSKEERDHPFSNATYRLRESISNLTTTHTQIKRGLEERFLDDAFQRELSNQSRFTYQLLRIVRQAELTQDLNYKTFPKEEAFDLALVCSGMADEAA